MNRAIVRAPKLNLHLLRPLQMVLQLSRNYAEKGDKKKNSKKSYVDMYESLAGKHIVVTGAAKGLGYAVCDRLAEVGSHLVAVDVLCDELDELKCKHKNIETVCCDLSNWDETREALECLQFKKGLYGLLNNAGIAIPNDFVNLRECELDQILAVNLKSYFNVTQIMLNHMKEGSCIVNLSSIAGNRAIQSLSAYCSSKGGINALTRNLALELGKRKIRANSVNPTVIMTDMGKMLFSKDEEAKPMFDKIPLGRFCNVDEVVDTCAYLLSERSSFVNGHHLYLEGGARVS